MRNGGSTLHDYNGLFVLLPNNSTVFGWFNNLMAIRSPMNPSFENQNPSTLTPENLVGGKIFVFKYGLLI